MANGLPRAELRKTWSAPEHFSALDNDVDEISAAMKEGFQKVADQLERNRKTWQWAVGLILSVAAIITTIVIAVAN